MIPNGRLAPRRPPLGAPIASPTRAALAVAASVVGAIPAMLGTFEDRSLALGLPVIALALAFLLNRIDRRQPLLADLAAAVLLVCPGLAAHGWLRLRALDAMAWYRPELAVLGVLDQAAGSGAGAGLLLGGAVSLAALRGRRAGPLIGAMVAAGIWLGAGGLSVALLAVSLRGATSWPVLMGVSLTAEWGVGAVLGAVLGIAGARGIVDRRGRGGSAALMGALAGAGLCAATTAPVHLLADQLDLGTATTALPDAPPGPRLAGATLAPRPEHLEADLARAFAELDRSPGEHPWVPHNYPRAAWADGLRLSAIVALPPDAPREALDVAARSAFAHNTRLLGLPARAEGLPTGVVDDLLGWPTAELLLDPPPENTPWLVLSADGGLAGLDRLPTSDRLPDCGLRAAPDVTVSLVVRTVLQLTRGASGPPVCGAIAWPPARCHPDGAGDPHCPHPAPL